MDIFTQKENYKQILEVSKRLIGFFFICLTISFLIITSYQFYQNPISYSHIIAILNKDVFSAHSEAIIIWCSFLLIYLREYFPYQFIIVAIPLFWISDTMWNLISFIDHPLQINVTILYPVWQQYEITLASISILIIIFFHLRFYISELKIMIFLTFLIIYILSGVPIVHYETTNFTTPINIIWEAIWQIMFLFTFGDMFIKNKIEKFKLNWYVKL